ncbi:hypothetical protein Q7I18_07470 [Aeromonas veronii]|uniref:hypothetical protein n=1 Tax=Aeromonas veronii TaxID=654 RepID=UPI0030050154
MAVAKGQLANLPVQVEAILDAPILCECIRLFAPLSQGGRLEVFPPLGLEGDLWGG